MAENQSINQEEPYWRRLVLSWVSCAQLNTGLGNHDLTTCYYNFRRKIKEHHDLQETTVVEFLRAKFPHFELQLEKANEIPESDDIYVFSLMLYFSCVRHSIPYFQNICQQLDVAYQHSIKAFLNSFVPENDNKIIINRAFMNNAFQNAKRSATALSEDSCNRRDHNQYSVQMLTSTPIGKLEMKKPSPPTPKSVALEWKVKNLHAMLESARTENIAQERQIEQLLQNVKELQGDKKKYQSKISALQLKETCACTSNSTELSHPTNRATEQLQKQIEINNKIIEELQEEINQTKEIANTTMERYMAIKKQYATAQEDNQRLKMSAEDLKEELILRDNINQNLTESVNDLRRFIRENHIGGAALMEPLDSSFDYLDKSFKNLTSDDSQYCDSENLASTVIDIKLKEKEHENEELTKKIQEMEDKIQDMQRSHNEMLEQQQTVSNAKIIEIQRSLTESEELKTLLTRDLDKYKIDKEDLIGQLKFLKELQIEETERLQIEMKEKTTELQRRLDEAEESKTHIENELKKAQAIKQDLHNELNGMNEQMAELRHKVADAANDRLQLTSNLEKGKAKIADLIAQLESQKKIHIEEHERLQAEMNVKTTELQRCLDAAEESKICLADKLKKEEAKTQDLNRELALQKNQQTNWTEQNTSLRQTLADAEKKIVINLEQVKAEKEDLVGQCKSLKQLQIEETERLQIEMNEKTTELQRRLDEAEESKTHIENELKKAQAIKQDLHNELNGMNEQMAELRQKVADAANDRLQLEGDLKKSEAKIADLIAQLESQKKVQIEECERLQAEMNVKTTELQRCLDMAKKSKTWLVDELKKEQTKTYDLNRELNRQQNLLADMDEETIALRQALADAETNQLQIAINLEQVKVERQDLVEQLKYLKQQQTEEIERLQDEMNEKTSELQRRLDDAEKSNIYLTDDLEKRNANIDDLICQLESQKKIQIEESERLQADMNVKSAELQQCLDAAEESKTCLAGELKKEQAKKEDLDRELVIQHNLQADMNKQIAKLRQSLANAEKYKPQLIRDLQKNQSKVEDLINQLELLKQLQMQEREQVQVEMKAKIADVRQAEKDKSKLASELEERKTEREDLICQLNSQKKQQMEEQERLQAEIQQKNAEMRQALTNAENDKSLLVDELNRLKSNEAFTTSLRTEMLEKISALQLNLEREKEKSEEINCQYIQVKKYADDLGMQCTKLMQKMSDERTEMSNLQKDLAGKEAKMQELNALYEKSYQDNEILSVKLYKARSALKEKEDAWTKAQQDMKTAMEEKLRDARVEFDSTMEKMKERMKELHKEVKTKLECDNQGLALTADGYKRKVDNLEIRCSKLQKQLAEMNERNLEVRKENQHLHIKLKTLEEFSHDRKSLMLPSQASLRSNLRMEDEEGELFNNMYLADLKSGRCVSPGPTNGGLDRYSELSQRNSKRLPHLRTNYVALAPDCEPPSHDDTRDTMSTTFDDSSTGLITRRKVSGITSYKRPGPPTPSKRAGRLSLNGGLAGNGGEIQYKDALRDTNVNAATGGTGSGAEPTGTTRAGRTKTPGKFKQMISSSSLLNNFQRDEGHTSAMPNATARRVTDNTQDMPSNRPISLKAVAKHKRFQRKMLFDSNRCLANQDCAVARDETRLPLGTILECPISKKKSLEEDSVQSRTVSVVKPIAPVTTAPLAMTRTTTTLTDNTTTTTITATHVTTTHMELVTALAASDYSFKHPYGSNRHNILRMQAQSREKRRQLYDETRKVAPKGIAPVSIGSPAVGVTGYHRDEHDLDSTSDITVYHSFTNDIDDSYNLPLPQYSACPISTPGPISAGEPDTGTLRLLLLLAYVGFFAQILFCLGNCSATMHRPHDGQT
ncbi:putative leucine-rich repeat-containing protein DDB_G0290503 [Anopheles marshallii]|uniref:putative leucine-rich repeat-containing protein DDB_G0290503 n=1 Tax=Anopheles marshallii TaxID=1521116 RepID=UPI00237BC6DE|nr:putative leucine-rich repeat-containing protein DDB_G0290503 [Anopheles marshallii]